MRVDTIYNSILKNPKVWNYYNKDILVPEISNIDECYIFVKSFIKYSEKSKTTLFKWVDYLNEHSPRRLSHIVSTFFLGLWLYRNGKNKYLHETVKSEFKRMKCFELNSDDIDKQFTYVWFMATLFHDLGYFAEDKKDGEPLSYHTIPFVGSVPIFYGEVYEKLTLGTTTILCSLQYRKSFGAVFRPTEYSHVLNELLSEKVGLSVYNF